MHEILSYSKNKIFFKKKLIGLRKCYKKCKNFFKKLYFYKEYPWISSIVTIPLLPSIILLFFAWLGVLMGPLYLNIQSTY